MKYIFYLIGGILLLSSIYSLVQYALDYDVLSQYGKGYIWGKVLMFIIGAVLIYFGFKKSKKPIT